jgi:hypothetical protein
VLAEAGDGRGEADEPSGPDNERKTSFTSRPVRDALDRSGQEWTQRPEADGGRVGARSSAGATSGVMLCSTADLA